MKLGVNIDHICVLRAARGVNDPDIIAAMFAAIKAGSDQITVHLREDRRHIDDDDARRIKALCKVPLNIECSIDKDIINIIADIAPQRATLVPEKREELTTEGGLNTDAKGLEKAVETLKKSEIEVSLFIEPNFAAINQAKELECEYIELHTGAFANLYLMLNSNLSQSKYSIKALELPRAKLKEMLKKECERIKAAAIYAKSLGLEVAAGHGLNYQNTPLIASIPQICELNIGQSIIARSTITGLETAVKEMKELIKNC